MFARKLGLAATAVLALTFACAALNTPVQAQTQLGPTPTQLPDVPSLHEMLQGMNFPLALPVPEKADPMRLYKEGIETIARQHIALAGYEPVGMGGMVSGFFGRPAPRKTKMQAFIDKWSTPPFELKTLDDADKAIKMALESLDFRFDSYLVPKDVKLEDKRIDNTNVGIGIIIKLEGMQELLKNLPKDATEEMVDKALVISDEHYIKVTPVRDAPAAKAGMKDGDVIKEVAGKSVNGRTYNDVLKGIKGKKGTKVDITVEREENGAKVLKKLTITRDDYEVPVVTLKHLGDGVWHLHLETFAARNAAKDVKNALDEVMKQGGKMLIFDLRDNGGGLVDQAIDIASFMIPEGTIVTQQHRLFGSAAVVESQSHVTTQVMLETHPQPSGILPVVKPRYLAVPPELPIVVLVNEWSASASELVSGALKFNKRVKLVGVRTFGKGVGQALLDLPYGRRLHVTSFYFLPANKFTDWIGIDVDVEVKAEIPEEGKPFKDNQLEAAVKVVKEMYENGIKERAEEAKKNEAVIAKHKEEWKKIQQRRKEAEEKAAKEKAEKEKAGQDGKSGQPGDAKPAQPGDANKPAQPNEAKPGEAKPAGDGKENPADAKPAAPAGANPGETKPSTPATTPGDSKPGAHPADSKPRPADGNPADVPGLMNP